MKYTRTASSPGRDVTHVLHWVPLYTDSRYGDEWALQSVSEYEAAARPGPDYNTSPRDAEPGKLAEWAAEVIGVPVTLEPGSAVILPAGTRRRHGKGGGKEPLYHVRPQTAGDASPESAVSRLRGARGSLLRIPSGSGTENA